MTTNDIDAIRKLANAATPGPWTAHTTYPHTVWQGSKYDEDPGMISTSLAHEVVADAVFIAAARTDVPALCDEVERLRAQLGEILAMAERFDTPRDSSRVRVFLGDLKHLAYRAINGQPSELPKGVTR